MVLVDILRAARTAHLDDRVWIRIHDVRGALGARTCGIEDALVTEPTNVDAGASLGALYLRGVRASTRAASQHLVARNGNALRCADHFLAADRVPHCATGL